LHNLLTDILPWSETEVD